MSGEDNAQSAICFAARSAARREETNRARGNGRQGRPPAPCVARAHALPTRGSARRTLGYVARPLAALGATALELAPRLSAQSPFVLDGAAHAAVR